MDSLLRAVVSRYVEEGAWPVSWIFPMAGLRVIQRRGIGILIGVEIGHFGYEMLFPRQQDEEKVSVCKR